MALLFGCLPHHGKIRWNDGGDVSLPYSRALSKWTRNASAYGGLETRFAVQATCFSPNFIHAWARERATRADLIPREADALQQSLLQQASTELRFFLVLETREPHWDDLATTRPSLKVRIFTTDGDTFIEPTSIKEIGNDEMADLRVLFPYARPNATGYWIIFPHQPDPNLLRMQIGGTPASLNLEWSVWSAETVDRR